MHASLGLRRSARVLQLAAKLADAVLYHERQFGTQQEGREALRRLIEANREAGEAVVESSRGLFGRARERAREVVRTRRGGNGAKAEAPAARPRARRKSRTRESE